MKHETRVKKKKSGEKTIEKEKKRNTTVGWETQHLRFVILHEEKKKKKKSHYSIKRTELAVKYFNVRQMI